MPQLTPIQRTSLTTSIEERYNQSPSIANVGGGNAKDVGKIGTNAMDQSYIFSNQFIAKNPVGFTKTAEDYSS